MVVGSRDVRIDTPRKAPVAEFQSRDPRTHAVTNAVDAVTRNRSMTTTLEVTFAERLKLTALALFVIATWLLLHPYKGLFQDATIYALAALARLHPQSLSHDVFLRFGSQDQYTLFSPLYAEAIRWLGLDPAAALLTFMSQIALYLCAYIFARRFMPARLALLGVGLLAALPTDYGSLQIFSCTEDFLTPRLPAEALVLGGLSAVMVSRYAVGVLCLLGAVALHPIIGSAGVALLLCMFVAVPRPRLALMLSGACIGVSLLFVGRTDMLSRFDPAWFQTIRGYHFSNLFVFPSTWPLSAWSRASLPMAVLGTGLLVSSDRRIRRLCAASLIMALSGIVLTMLYCDLFHIVIATQMQVWRWLWLSSVVAVLLAPPIVGECWNRSPAVRAVPMLIASACVFRGSSIGLVLSLSAVVCAGIGDQITRSQTARLVLQGSIVLLLAAVAAEIFAISSYLEPHHVKSSTAFLIVHWLRERTGDGFAYAGLFALLVARLGQLRSVRGAAALAGVAALACVVLASITLKPWFDFQYTRTNAAKFADWREQLPPEAEGIWPDTPVGSWYFLGRPVYWSKFQEPGAIFSRGKALELDRREHFITDSLNGGRPASTTTNIHNQAVQESPLFVDRANTRQWALLCRDPALQFFVTRGDDGSTPFKPIMLSSDQHRRALHLYRCSDFKSGKAPG